MLIFLDSFQHYSTAEAPTKWTQLITGTNGGSSGISSSLGRRGGGCWQSLISGSGVGVGNRLTIVPSTPIPSGPVINIGFAFQSVTQFAWLTTGTNPDAGGSSGQNSLFAVYKATTLQVWARVNTNGTISVFCGSTLLGTTTTALIQGTWQYLEFQFTINSSTGTVTVNLNGVTILALTGQNTNNAGSTSWDEFRIGAASSNPSANGAAQFLFCDLYVSDGSGSDGWSGLMGDLRVDALLPTANGATVNFTPLTSSNYVEVSEQIADGDTSYNLDSNVGDKDVFTFPNAPVPGALLLGVQIVAQARLSTAGAGIHGAVAYVLSGEYAGYYIGSGQAVSSSYSFLRQCWGVEPWGSGSDWNDTDFNTTEFGYKKIS
jgi:hypothetical protein